MIIFYEKNNIFLIKYDSSLRYGQKVKVRTKVCYKGKSKRRQLGKVYTAYYLQKGSYLKKLGTDSSTIGTDDKCDGESARLRIPRNISRGNYQVMVFSDYKGKIDEVDEGNNIKFLNVRIR